jgi:hypothetical protein
MNSRKKPGPARFFSNCKRQIANIKKQNYPVLEPRLFLAVATDFDKIAINSWDSCIRTSSELALYFPAYDVGRILRAA